MVLTERKGHIVADRYTYIMLEHVRSNATSQAVNFPKGAKICAKGQPAQPAQENC